MHLDAVVSVLVAELTAKTLREGCEGIGHLGVVLLLLALLGGELALLADIVERLVDIDVARGLIEDGACSVELGLDVAYHLGYGRHLDDGLAKLTAVAGIGECLLIGGLRDAHSLSGNAKAGTVHQCHHIFDESEAALTTELGLGILVYKFAGGTALDAHLVLDAAYGDTTVTLVVDEHGEAAAIPGALFGAGQHEVYVAVAVGDEAQSEPHHWSH